MHPVSGKSTCNSSRLTSPPPSKGWHLNISGSTSHDHDHRIVFLIRYNLTCEIVKVAIWGVRRDKLRDLHWDLRCVVCLSWLIWVTCFYSNNIMVILMVTMMKTMVALAVKPESLMGENLPALYIIITTVVKANISSSPSSSAAWYYQRP